MMENRKTECRDFHSECPMVLLPPGSKFQVPGPVWNLGFGIWDFSRSAGCQFSVLSSGLLSVVSCQLSIVYCLLSVSSGPLPSSLP